MIGTVGDVKLTSCNSQKLYKAIGIFADKLMRSVFLFLTMLILTLGSARQVYANPPTPTTADEWLVYLLENPHRINSVCAEHGAPVTDEYLKKVERFMQRRLGAPYGAWVLWGKEGNTLLRNHPALGRAGPCTTDDGQQGFGLLFRGQPTRLTVQHEMGHFYSQFLPLFRKYGYDDAVKAYSDIPDNIAETTIGKPCKVSGTYVRSVQDLLSNSRRWKYPDRPGAYSPAEKAAQTLYAVTAGIPCNDESAILTEFEKPDPISTRNRMPNRRGVIVLPLPDSQHLRDLGTKGICAFKSGAIASGNGFTVAQNFNAQYAGLPLMALNVLPAAVNSVTAPGFPNNCGSSAPLLQERSNPFEHDVPGVCAYITGRGETLSNVGGNLVYITTGYVTHNPGTAQWWDPTSRDFDILPGTWW